MGRILIDLFTTLDGVAQAPGGPEEDASDGFQFGGWQAPLIDEVVGQQVQDGIATMDALLLGRKTYDIFASYWPHQEGGADDSIARQLNRVPKYVASRQALHLEWAGSSLIGPSLAETIGELRERHDEVHVIGSLDLVQSLLREKLFDQLTLWVYPILLGRGKRVFADGVIPTSLKLMEPVVVSPSGAIMQRYELLAGKPMTGDMAARD